MNTAPEAPQVEDDFNLEVAKDIKCELCLRHRPIFVVDSDESILRLPDKFLPQFLKNLRQDFLNKRQYLKFLKVNSKVI